MLYYAILKIMPSYMFDVCNYRFYFATYTKPAIKSTIVLQHAINTLYRIECLKNKIKLPENYTEFLHFYNNNEEEKKHNPVKSGR